MRPPVKKSVRQIVVEQAARDPDFAEAYEAARAEGTLARQLATLRERRGLTQRDLAHVTGISQPMINRLERAGENPTLATLQKLAGALAAVVEIGGDQIAVRDAQPAIPAKPARIDIAIAANTNPAIRYLTINHLVTFGQGAPRISSPKNVTVVNQGAQWQGEVYPPQATNTRGGRSGTALPLGDNMAWPFPVREPLEMSKPYGASAPELVT